MISIENILEEVLGDLRYVSDQNEAMSKELHRVREQLYQARVEIAALHKQLENENV